MITPTDKNFCDWYNHAFGFGYGSGEPKIVPILRQFLIALLETGTYDYEKLEQAFSPVVTWLLIDDELIELAADVNDISSGCGPKTCNCGPNGYEKGRVCPNPLWGDDRRFIR